MRSARQWLPWLAIACAVWWVVGSPLHVHQTILPGRITSATTGPTAPGPVPHTPAAVTRDHDSSHVEIEIPQPLPASEIPPELAKKWDRWGDLQVTVRDARTEEPLPGAEVVLAETGQRLTTNELGKTAVVKAPVVRDPRYDEVLAKLHGQLTLVVYKNGYRDSVEFGVRIHDGNVSEETVYAYKITPEDRRVEPSEQHHPFHHIYLLELTNRFRSNTQPGEGPQAPDRG